ncbi:putative LPS assembly protein LptD [Mucilaginibacter sp.]|uniref:putative LPS assembly protein LptD n=1 Tax=Mucilaginibacter sp. TaxID=1882438 RepID=UPI00261294EB|nr:putative LPS assembly protein LptD [Mucilaginibacter sp.]MDB4927179.1 LPS-assembly protein LptD [Mucilaginibacter sp.]
MAFAHKSRVIIKRPVVDTIIKLDSTNKYPKLSKGKKSKATSTAKKVVGADTTKKNQTLDSEIKEIAADSATNDVETGISQRFGKARVTYGDFELDADYIRIDRKQHIIFASGRIDPKTKRYVGRPISKQGSDKPITSDSLQFNYETKKGLIHNVLTEQDGNYISHGQAKKISETEVAYHNIIFSACDKPDPDYGIVITRGIGEKNRIISGPAYLEIEGVPIPIGIPFGFFPKPDTRSSGLILPTPGEDATLGFFLRDFGYYMGLSDYADLTNLGTYYSNGSYEVSSTLDYMSRYKYSGNLALSYGSHNYGLAGDPPARDFHIAWTHSQNPNASPGSTFSASVNAGTSSFYQNNPASIGYNLQQLTQNALRSSISYSKSWTGWGGAPLNLTVGLSHSQDLTLKTVSLELPSLNFSMGTINPFDKRDRVGEQKWYQKITIGYTMTATNRVTAVPESQLFTSETLTKRLQNGIQHSIPLGFNLTVLKYFQFGINVNYTERWYLQTIRERYARADSLVTDTIPGFQRAGNYSMGVSLSTKVYGTINFKNSKIRAIRHTMTPSIGFGYSPDYSGFNHTYNRSIVSNASIPYPVVYTNYSIFDHSVYGGPSGRRQAGINISLDNSLEAKVRPKSTDTSQTDRKIQLLQSLSFSTTYNIAADSFKLSPISFSGHTSVLHDRVNLSFGGTLNPYETRVMDSVSSGQIQHYKRDVNRYTLQDGKLPTILGFNFSASASLNPATFHPSPTAPAGSTYQTATPDQLQKMALYNPDPGAYIDFNIPWNLSLNYSFSYSNAYISTSNTNTLMISGDLSLTKKWKIQYNTNYDLKALKLSSATSFAIYRDLHCWDLSIQWLPFGYYKSYSVTLRVKSTILQALKLSKKSDYTSNSYFQQ